MAIDKMSKVNHNNNSLPRLSKPSGPPAAAGGNTNVHEFSPAWLRGGGPIEAPARKPNNNNNNYYATHGASRGTTMLPDVNRVRSQTFHGSDPATRQSVRSNPDPLHDRPRRANIAQRRKSNSAPNPFGSKNVNKGPTNHDRTGGESRILPKINSLGTGGISTQSQSDHILAGSNKRWATSWADARANHPNVKSSDKDDANSTTSPLRSNQSSSLRHQPYSQTRKNSTGNSSSVTTTTNSNRPCLERKPISNLNPKYYNGAINDTSHLAEGNPITQAYTTDVVHVNSRRTGAFVDYDNAGGKKGNVVKKGASGGVGRRGGDTSRRTSVVSTCSSTATTPRRGVSFRPVPKCRKPVIITKKTVKKQKNLSSVYDNKTFRVQRKAWILKKMEVQERQNIEEYNKQLEEREKKMHESTVNQRNALKKVRDQFDADQVKRFTRQYVSWKSVETERLTKTRTIYGLPDNIYDDRYDRTLKDVASEKKVKGKKKEFKQYATWIKNIKRFESMLNPDLVGNPENNIKNQMPAIVEGIDTVQLTNKGPKSPKKPVRVRQVIGSAKRLLTANEDLDDTSVRSLRVDDDGFAKISMVSSLSDEDDDVDDDDDDYDDLSLSEDDDDDDYKTTY